MTVNYQRLPDNIPEGVYHKLDFDKGAFVALRPLVFGVRFIGGDSTSEKITYDVCLGQNDQVIELYYNIFVDVLSAGIPLTEFPETTAKPATSDPEWVKALKVLWGTHVNPGFSERPWIPVTPFRKMQLLTIKPLINFAKKQR